MQVEEPEVEEETQEDISETESYISQTDET